MLFLPNQVNRVVARRLFSWAMTTRDALEADLISLAELLLVVQKMHVDAEPDVYCEITREIAVEALCSKLEQGCYMRLAETGAEVLGYCAAEIKPAMSIAVLQPRNYVYLSEIVVSPNSRRSGIGRALVDDLRAFARQQSVSEIELDVGCFNSVAKAFFQSVGFEVKRERMTYRGDLG